MLKNIWKLIRNTVVFVGVLLSFIAFMELVRAYETLHNLHPIAGYLFAAGVLGGLLYMILYYWSVIGSQPKVLVPPKIDDFANASDRQIRKFSRYLIRYMERLAINPNIDENFRSLADAGAGRLQTTLDLQYDRVMMIDQIKESENNVIRPILDVIDEKAGRHIRDSMRDIMIAVTLSPYQSVDIFIVVYRNFRMILDLIKMYNARPAFKEQVMIFYDIFSVVATVNYIHLGRNLIQTLGTRIPGVGRFLDDIAQGIGAGFMTTITGHAAMARCRAFTGWDAKKARENILSHVGDFYADVRDLFFKDVWGSVMTRSGQALSSAQDAVASAIDETGKTINKVVQVPVKAAAGAGQGIYKVGSLGTKAVTDTIKNAGKWVTRPFVRKDKPKGDLTQE